MEWQGKQIGSLNALSEILDEWLIVNHMAVTQWDGDVPWRYNERASLSTLAGAVWRKGGFVIEEFPTEKLDSNEEYSFGRCDMWFEYGGKEYYLEAKLCLPSLSYSGNPSSSMSMCLQNARQDALKLKRYEIDHIRCGLAISIPVLDFTKKMNRDLACNEQRRERQMMRWINAVRAAGSSCAWYLRQDLEWGKFSDGIKPDLFYPGVALIIDPVDQEPVREEAV